MALPVPVSWFGGKTHLRDFILPHIEGSGKIYVEAFCGSANIFFAKTPHPVEVVNDLNGDVVNFFRVLQSRKLFPKFAHRTRWTPYALEEFCTAVDGLKGPPPDGVLDLDRAWAFFVRGTLGFGGLGDSPGNWRRSFEPSDGTAMVITNWRVRVALLEAYRDRLLQAQVDHRPALDVIEYWDTPDTTFYLDPPYVEHTRESLNVYMHEMNDSQHLDLVSALLKVKGRVVLSGYAASQYHGLEDAGWLRIDKTILSPATGFHTEGGRRPRTESLWINRMGVDRSLWESEYLPADLRPTPTARPVETPRVLPPPVDENWSVPSVTVAQGSLWD